MEQRPLFLSWARLTTSTLSWMRSLFQHQTTRSVLTGIWKVTAFATATRGTFIHWSLTLCINSSHSYYTDNSLSYKCSLSAPSYCSWNNQTDALSNDFIPYINWWNNAQVYGDQLYFSIASDLVSGRRTLIELPNSQCNFLNQPMYYQKHSMGCMDVIDVQIPFVNCGFTKISTPYEDFYKGTANVRQIDQITVGGIPTERVIDTPFPISIRMPKQLAVSTNKSYLDLL